MELRGSPWEQMRTGVPQPCVGGWKPAGATTFSARTLVVSKHGLGELHDPDESRRLITVVDVRVVPSARHPVDGDQRGVGLAKFDLRQHPSAQAGGVGQLLHREAGSLASAPHLVAQMS